MNAFLPRAAFATRVLSFIIFLAAILIAHQGCQDSSGPLGQAAPQATVNLTFPDGLVYDKSAHALYPSSGANNAVLPPYVTGITLTISGEDMETVTLPVNLSTLQVSFAITPGVRTFSILVSTSIGLTFTDSLTVEVVSGAPLYLNFNLVVNAPPSIIRVTATPANAKPGETIALACSAEDPDPQDNLRYSWSGPDGWSASGPTAQFTAPGYGSFTFTCFVEDGRGGTASGQASARAAKPNSPPVINSVSASPACLPLQTGTTALSCSAYDPDGDPLTYSWSVPTSCNALSGPSISCQCNSRLPGAMQATCVVSDGNGGQAAATVNY